MSWSEEWVKEYDKTRDRIGRTTADAMNWVFGLPRLRLRLCPPGILPTSPQKSIFLSGGVQERGIPSL